MPKETKNTACNLGNDSTPPTSMIAIGCKAAMPPVGIQTREMS